MYKLTVERDRIRNIVAKSIKRNISAWILIIPSLYVMYIVLWKPIVTGLVLSFFDLRGFEAVNFVGIKNFVDVIGDPIFLKTLINTISYVIWSLVIGFLPPIIFAIILNEMVHCNSFFKFSLYFPAIVPAIAVSLIWKFMFDPGDGGLLNMLLSKFHVIKFAWLQNPDFTIPLIILTITWRCFGSTTIFYLASLQGVNQELYEAAKLDGANTWNKIKNITLPQISGIVLLFLVNQIIGVFQVMVEPLTMTDGGPVNGSMSLGLQSYYYAFRYMKPAKSLALGVIMFLILMIFTVFYFAVKKKVEDN